MAMQLLGVELCRIAHAWTCAVLEHVPPLQVVLGSSYVVYSAYWRTQVVTLLENHCTEYVAGKMDLAMLPALLLGRQVALLFA